MLRSDAAAAFEALNVAYRGRFGQNISITDSYRTYDQQVALKAQKGNLAATPGTSNHGWALAVDLGGGINTSFTSVQYLWMSSNAPRYGWINPAWAKPGPGYQKSEPWHWEFTGSTTIPTPTPNPPQEDIIATLDELRSVVRSEIKQLHALLLRSKAGGIVLVNGKGAHVLTPGEWETLRNLGYAIDHDEMDQGPFDALVRAYGGFA
ncbi:M15 family metallopeptidase [Sanguibacter sp. 25GB23B1]|uniref:M15 family metallopeptidase n=1 Tax=unclassified Sanguibacter TaxID=2645534 RepID=UPI0032AF71D3